MICYSVKRLSSFIWAFAWSRPYIKSIESAVGRSGPRNGNPAMAALRFRFAPPTNSHGAGGNLALTINAHNSVGPGQKTEERTGTISG
jgi:hypothetical protein